MSARGETSAIDGSLGRRRHFLRLAAAVILAQAAYWLIFYPWLNFRPEQPQTYAFERTEAAVITAPTRSALDAATFSPVSLPWSDCCAPGYRAFRLVFKLDSVPTAGLGLVPIINADNTAVYMNGAPIFENGSMDADDPDAYRLREILYVSPGLLRQGDNVIDYIMVRTRLPYFDVNNTPILGAHAEIERAYGHRVFVFNEYQIIASTIGLIVAVFSLVVFLRSAEGWPAFWVTVLSLSWSAQSIWLIAPVAVPTELYYPLFVTFSGLIPVAWLCFADAWTGHRTRWLAPLCIAAFTGLTALAFVLFRILPPPGGYDSLSSITHYWQLAFGLAAVARFAWHIARHRDDRVLEVAVFALCISLIGIDALAELWANVAVGHIQYSQPLLLVALGLAFLGRNVRLFRSMTDFNLLLTRKLHAREAELAEGFAARQAVEKERVLIEERKRIMRDMHDGVGGRLMSIAASLRGVSPPAHPTTAENLLQLLDEIRLIVDSLDTAGDDLGLALGAFRGRMDRKLEQAGLEVCWDISEDTADTILSADEVLQVFRILQEACSNTLRHASATRLTISVQRKDKDLMITIEDNGQGDASVVAAENGRGIANIKDRANRLSATIIFESAQPGLRILLLLPDRLPRSLSS